MQSTIYNDRQCVLAKYTCGLVCLNPGIALNAFLASDWCRILANLISNDSGANRLLHFMASSEIFESNISKFWQLISAQLCK